MCKSSQVKSSQVNNNCKQKQKDLEEKSSAKKKSYSAGDSITSTNILEGQPLNATIIVLIVADRYQGKTRSVSKLDR